jgi:hypothetical protein
LQSRSASNQSVQRWRAAGSIGRQRPWQLAVGHSMSLLHAFWHLPQVEGGLPPTQSMPAGQSATDRQTTSTGTSHRPLIGLQAYGGHWLSSVQASRPVVSQVPSPSSRAHMPTRQSLSS